MTLEKQFEQEMINIYTTAKKECGYNASRFLQLVSTKGGLAAAKQLIGKSGGTEGFGHAVAAQSAGPLCGGSCVETRIYRTLF